MFDINLLPQKVRDITPYKVDKNQYKIRLDANESFIDFPEEQRNEIETILSSASFNRYPDCEAEKLCEAFAEYYGIDRRNVIAGNGSDEIISLIMSCFCEKGGKTAVFSPDFSMYSFYATLAEQEVITIGKDENLHIDFDATSEILHKEKPNIVIFSNPCNPTGVLENKESLKKLILSNPKTIFISDEAYMDFADDTEKESFLKDVRDYPNLMVLKTLSKAMGCACLRVGFLVADQIAIQSFFKVKSPYNLNSLSQAFATAVLKNSQSAKARTEKIRLAKKYLEEKLQELESDNFKLVGSSANFITVITPRAEKIYKYLLENKISIRKFSFHGGALRITAGTKEETDILINCMKSEVENTNG